MKRTVTLLSILLILTLSLTGCIVIPQYKYYEISPDDVISVQIYDLRKSESYYGDFIELDNPVYTLDDDSKTDFITELSEIRFKDVIIITIAAIDPCFTYDEWVARINYNDGSYDLISCDGYNQSYNANNECVSSNHYSCDNDEWKAFITSYLPEDFLNGIKQVS
ncbi:MAG: hypothetical protein IKT46_04275 [Clostridia bacterium]|nr:hypothetical protein [Clostridia bacterium]